MFIDWALVAPRAIDTFVFTVRMLAAALSVIALGSWYSCRKRDEYPPYDRRRNELAWNWAHLGMIVGGCSFIALDFEYRNVTGEAVADLFVAFVWWCWANAATVRLGSRVPRPRFVYGAATIFLVGGFVYTFFMGS
ncbi:hypothetical protein AAW00_13655 [Aurantiacibacter luteus]|uniref:Uncharacterized protein n=2 Tax=Aurantiacibacter luteus TaxID=1581420 RepID=A0A0G9MPD6_9SPHN|nr:hypothetical protein AAW00_13655 [Aurantiacibacter luteus]